MASSFKLKFDPLPRSPAALPFQAEAGGLS